MKHSSKPYNPKLANVFFKSGMDMYILHDIYLEVHGLSAQIDYIVITRKHIYVIECKNLIGNIEIDHTGSFIRTYELFGKKIKEGIYSPITQNERHLQVLKEIGENKSNFLTKMLFFFSHGSQLLVEWLPCENNCLVVSSILSYKLSDIAFKLL